MVAAEPTTTELSLGGPSGVLFAAGSAIFGKVDKSLTFGRGIVDAALGFVLRDINESLSPAEQEAQFVETRAAVSVNGLASEAQELHEELAEFLDFSTPQSLSLDNLLERLSQLLLNPRRAPGEKCLAPAPLLRDLLDIALGRLKGGIGAVIAKVGGTVQDLLLPGFATEGDLSHFVQAILDDPITAALNLVLGQRSQIDCVVEGGLGVAESVLEQGVRRLKEAIAEALF